MRRASTLLAVVVALAVAGCGSADDSTEDQFASAKAFLAETAYLPSYQRCVIREAERMVTPAELRTLEGLPQDKVSKAGADILEPATVKCKEEAAGPIIDPDATAAELAPLRDLTAQGIALGTLESGANRAQARCVERGIEAMSDAEVIELGNASGLRAVEKLVLPVVNSCLGV